MKPSRISGILGLAGLLIVWSSITVSMIVSGCFNIFSMALSDLGDWATACGNNPICLQQCSRISEPVFNYGLIASGILIAVASIGLYIRYKRAYAIPLVFSGIALSLVGFLPERYGTIHFLAALSFFLLLPVSMLLFAKQYHRSDRMMAILSIVLSMMSLSGIILFIYVKVLSLRLGYAIPEIIGATPASVWLEIVFLKYLLGSTRPH